MSVLDTIRSGIRSDWQGLRAFVVGPGVVDQSMTHFGLSGETYQPAAYATYPAISNAVYACINQRTTALASLPLKLYSKRVSADGQRKEITTGPARDLLDSVNPYWTFERWVQMTEMALCVWGESFTFFHKQGRKPTELWWARADRVRVHPHPTDYISHFTCEPVNGGQPIRWERDETLWLRFPNPDNEFEGLSPLAAARLAADTASAAMKSNFNIFRNGIQGAALISQKGGTPFSKDQAKELQDDINRRMRGVDNAHRIGILRAEVDIRQLSMTPKDAEFLGMMAWSLEDVARAYKIPPDMVGGKRTYQNVESSERAFWTRCILPEARMIAAEITEQLLPLFGGDMVAEFDISGIDVLHEAEKDRWEREAGQIDRGVLLPNEWRKQRGLTPVPWGDVWWAQSALMPIDSDEKPAPQLPPALSQGGDPDRQDDDPDPPEKDDEATERARRTRAIAYGSPEHVALWNQRVAQQEPWERRFGAELARLMADQRQSILAQLRQRGLRNAEALALEPFDKGRWIKAFRLTMRPLTQDMVINFGELARDELGFAFAFDVQDPNIIRAIETQVQSFVEEVTQTTWTSLRDTIRDGIDAGETIDQIAERVEQVMRDRIRSSKETIARTEVARASNAGTLEAWRQSGVVTQKRWLAAIDDRTRATHIDAHEQVVGINDNFRVGGGEGPTPGQIGIAREDINCRCSMVPVLDVEAQQSTQPKPLKEQPRPRPLPAVDDDLVTVIVEGGL